MAPVGSPQRGWGSVSPVLADTDARPPRVATYTLAALLWLAIFALYSMRANLSIALHGDRGMATDFGWGDRDKGVLLSAFFWGYITSQLPGGWLATKFGGKRVLLAAMICSIGATAATPLAATASLGAAIACRVVLGVASGVLYPTLASMIGRWVTDVDRATCYNLADTGGSCGIILCALGGPWLIEHGTVAHFMGWQFCFYYPAMIGAVWVVLWVVLVSDTPATSQWISARERSWILTSLHLEAVGVDLASGSPRASLIGKTRESDGVPWIEILAAPSLWGMYLGNVAANWTWYTLLTYLPQYLLEVMGFDLTQSGLLFAVPYLCMMISQVGNAQLTDRLISSGRTSLFRVRTVTTVAAGLGCAGCLVAVAQHGLGTTATIVLFAASLGFVAVQNSGSFLVANDLYPQFAGVCMGVSNTLGTVPGIVSPMLSGLLLSAGKCPKDEAHHTDTPSSCAQAWDKIFYIAALIYGLFAVSFVPLASAHFRGVGYRAPKGRRPSDERKPLLTRLLTNAEPGDSDSFIQPDWDT